MAQPTMSDRNPIFNPREGDILRRPNGVYVLVDLHEPLRTSFTCSDGSAGSFDYLDGWSRWIEGSTVIKLGSPETWPWHCNWTSYQEHVAHMPTFDEAQEYIRQHTSQE